MDQDVHIKNRVLSADMYYKNTLVLKYIINYPWLESTEFFQQAVKINQHYATKSIAYQQYCELSLYQSAAEEYDNSVKNGYPVRVFEANADYVLTYNRNCALSMYFDSYEFTGGAHGSTVRYSDTWNLKDARRMSLAEIYPSYKDHITDEISSIISAQIAGGNKTYFDNYNENVAQYFNPESFYINYRGVVVYFQQYEIAPYSSGLPEFTIPYSNNVRRPKCR